MNTLHKELQQLLFIGAITPAQQSQYGKLYYIP